MKRTILLADDDLDDKEMFYEALMHIDKNIVCHSVSDGLEAMNKLHELEENPDLIFLDINMPGINGWQCLQSLKEMERYKDIPVIIISTSSHPREVQIAQGLGALCYFVKPSDFSELSDMLHVIVKTPERKLADTLRRLQAAGSPFLYVFEETQPNAS